MDGKLLSIASPSRDSDDDGGDSRNGGTVYINIACRY